MQQKYNEEVVCSRNNEDTSSIYTMRSLLYATLSYISLPLNTNKQVLCGNPRKPISYLDLQMVGIVYKYTKKTK